MRARGTTGLTILAVATVLLLLAPSAAAAWLQAGGDPGQRGAVGHAGAKQNETALALQLDGGRPAASSPLVFGGHAYVLTLAGGGALVSVNLSTAAVRTLYEFGTPPSAFASDGQVFYVVKGDGVVAISAATGLKAWSLAWPPLGIDPARAMCVEPVIKGDHLYVSCGDWSLSSGRTSTGGPVFVAKVDLVKHDYAWVWTKDAGDEASGRVGLDAVSASVDSVPYALAVGEGHVYLVTHDTMGWGGTMQAYLWAINEVSGAYAWARDSSNTQTAGELQSAILSQDYKRATGRMFYNYAVPVVADAATYMKFQTIHALSARDGISNWQSDPRAWDDPLKRWDSGTGLALVDGVLYVSTRTTLLAYNPGSGKVNWAVQSLLEPDEQWHSRNLAVADGVLYAMAVVMSTGESDTSQTTTQGALYALDVAHGSPTLLWRHPLTPKQPLVHNGLLHQAYRFAVGEGSVVVSGLDGSLLVLGRTGASIQPRLVIPNLLPGVGEEFVLDLTATQPGRQGRDVKARVDWGDGQETDWGKPSRLTHRFALPADHVVTVRFENAAGQSSVETFVVEVGKGAPDTRGLVERLFDSDNQDKTFFALGTLITAAGALFGVSRVNRRRSLLAREMASIEDAYLMTNHIPLECERALSERKTRVRGLLLDNKITEPQFGILDRRVDELRSELRVNTLDESFDFMPVGLMKQLQRILADGSVTRSEHKEFIGLLERNPVLTKTQKRRVGGLVDRWFARDANEA